MKSIPAATGTCTWLENAPNGNMRLEIAVKNGEEETSHIYEVVKVSNGEWKLLRVDFEKSEVVSYTVRCLQRNLWQCDCPDAKYRRERRYTCKHARALPAALAKLPF